MKIVYIMRLFLHNSLLFFVNPGGHTTIMHNMPHNQFTEHDQWCKITNGTLIHSTPWSAFSMKQLTVICPFLVVTKLDLLI